MGLLEKSSIKVVRWDFETLKQAENEKVEARMHSAPTGKRHDAYYVYLNSIRLKELDRGHTVSWKRAAERCRRTHRPPHLATSADNFLEWRSDDRPATPSPSLSPYGSSPYQERPHTAPATSMSPTSWNMWNQAPQAASSPRYRARAAFHYKRCTTPDIDDVRKGTYARLAQQRRVERVARQEREAMLAVLWPHGMPAAGCKKMTEAGLRPMALNYGFPLSLPDRQYAALKSGMRGH